SPQAASSSAGEKRSGKGEYSLNFDDADLGEVAKVILGDILGKNYTISPQVTGKVTLQTTSPLTKEELMPTLDMLLGVNNAALVNQGGMYLIKPSAEAVYGAPVRGMASGYQTRVIPIRNVSAAEVAEILKPLLPEKSLLQADTNRNILLVAGSNAELNRVMDLVRIFDVDMLRGRSFGLFTPAHVDASKIIEELDQVFNHGGKKDKDGGESYFRFLEIDRLNAVLAITHQASYLQDIENWVRRLDRVDEEAGGVHVYRAQHVPAAELANTLGSIFGTGTSQRSNASIASGRKAASATNRSGGSSGGGSGSSGMGGSSSGSMNSGMNSGTGSSTGATANSQSGTGSFGSNPSLGGSGTGSSGGNVMGGGGQSLMPNVKIIGDEGNNALIIVAGSEDYAKILQTLKQLDVLPLQVLIDATIVEVTLNDDLKYGIEWYLKNSHQAMSGGGGGASVTDALTSIAAGTATGGFSYAFASKNIDALLHAESTKNNINVISSPSLMVLNNQEASIKVGDSVPTRNSVSNNLVAASGAAGTNIQTSSIQMVDTGINLLVRPRVNAGGLVLLDILQSANKAIKSTATSENIDSPTIQKREIQTNVAVQSGETVVLGGLIDEKNEDLHFGVPLLHQIPLIGPLFGRTTRNNDKTELVVLLTPRVMKSRQEAVDVTEEFKRKLTGIYDESIPVTR
ncbi:MAG: type II secretion system secretin GspD, partial [Methylococcaceae bacterium]|nr:type II secretion system secretin GspD [Methylococcaceae bacterium]